MKGENWRTSLDQNTTTQITATAPSTTTNDQTGSDYLPLAYVLVCQRVARASLNVAAAAPLSMDMNQTEAVQLRWRIAKFEANEQRDRERIAALEAKEEKHRQTIAALESRLAEQTHRRALGTAIVASQSQLRIANHPLSVAKENETKTQHDADAVKIAQLEGQLAQYRTTMEEVLARLQALEQ